MQSAYEVFSARNPSSRVQTSCSHERQAGSATTPVRARAGWKAPAARVARGGDVHSFLDASP